MKLILKELLDGFGDRPQDIGEVLVIHINEDHLPEVGIVWTDTVEDEDDHWANRFDTRPYTVAEIKALILDDQKRRRQRHLERAAQAAVVQ